MQVFRNNNEIQVKKWPTPSQWETQPENEIVFTLDRKNIIHPNDRIYMATQMITKGPNSGGLVDVYYSIVQVTDVKPNKIHMTNNDITAIAKRIEL